MADENYTAENFIGLGSRTFEQRLANVELVLAYGPAEPEFFPDAEARALKVFAYTDTGTPGLLNIEPLFEASDTATSSAVAAAASAATASSAASAASASASTSAAQASSASTSAASALTQATNAASLASTAQTQATASAASAATAEAYMENAVPKAIALDGPPEDEGVGLMVSGSIPIDGFGLLLQVTNYGGFPAFTSDGSQIGDGSPRSSVYVESTFNKYRFSFSSGFNSYTWEADATGYASPQSVAEWVPVGSETGSPTFTPYSSEGTPGEPGQKGTFENRVFVRLAGERIQWEEIPVLTNGVLNVLGTIPRSVSYAQIATDRPREFEQIALAAFPGCTAIGNGVDVVAALPWTGTLKYVIDADFIDQNPVNESGNVELYANADRVEITVSDSAYTAGLRGIIWKGGTDIASDRRFGDGIFNYYIRISNNLGGNIAFSKSLISGGAFHDGVYLGLLGDCIYGVGRIVINTVNRGWADA